MALQRGAAAWSPEQPATRCTAELLHYRFALCCIAHSPPRFPLCGLLLPSPCSRTRSSLYLVVLSYKRERLTPNIHSFRASARRANSPSAASSLVGLTSNQYARPNTPTASSDHLEPSRLLARREVDVQHARGQTDAARVTEHLSVRGERRQQVERQAAPEQHTRLMATVPLEPTAEGLQWRGAGRSVRVGSDRSGVR